MRRYELMLVLRPDVADDRSQAVIDRATRADHRPRAARSSRSPRGAAAGWPTRSTAIARARTTSSSSRRRPRPSPSSSAACTSPRRSCATSSPASSGPPSPPAATAAEDRARARGRRRLPSAEDEEDEDVRRADRRVRERSRSGRHRLIADQHQPEARAMSLNKAMIIGNLGRDPEMRYTPERPGGDPVHRRRQPQLQGPAGRVAGRDRVVPRRRLGPAGRARRGVPAQGQQGLRRRPHPDPPVGRPDRPEALHHRARRQPGHEPRAPRRATTSERGRRSPPSADPAARRPAGDGDAGRRRQASTTANFDDLPF